MWDQSLADMPLPLATTWAVLASVGAVLTRDDDVLVVDSAIPGHRWGQAISVLDPATVDAAPTWLARARQELPDRAYPAIGLPAEPDSQVWHAQPCAATGDRRLQWHPHHWVALQAERVRPRHALPPAYEVDLVEDPSRWEELAALPSAGGADYQRTWVSLKRARQDAGRAAFFAATHHGQIVATGGITVCGIGERTVARFEDIHTDAAHRRHGLASHVIASAHRWAQDHGARSSVLVSDADGRATSLYRALGFAPVDDAWMVLPRATPHHSRAGSTLPHHRP